MFSAKEGPISANCLFKASVSVFIYNGFIIYHNFIYGMITLFSGHHSIDCIPYLSGILFVSFNMTGVVVRLSCPNCTIYFVS